MIKYHYHRLMYHLRWGKTVTRIRRKLFCNYIYFKIRFLDSHNKLNSLKIMCRFMAFKNYELKKETRESQRDLMDAIAKLSDETGIPQWEIRSKLQRDFNLDI